MKVVKRDPLTLKQRAFVEAYLTNGGNATDAARKAGYNAKSYDAFSAVGYDALNKPAVIKEIENKRISMRQIFDEMGATDEEIAQTLVDGMKNAKKFFFKGDKLASVVDHAERRQNAKLIADIKDLMPTKHIEVSGEVKSDVPALKQIADLLQKVYEQEDTNHKYIDIEPIQELEG